MSSLTFTMLLVGVYLAVAAASITDRQIVVGTTLALPLLQVQVSLSLFFVVAPVIFLAVYVNNIVHVDALIRRHHAYCTALKNLTPDDRCRELLLLVPQTFIEAQEEPTPRPWRLVIAALAWCTWLLAPLAILLYLQYAGLRYQDWAISVLQTATLVTALAAYRLTQTYGLAGTGGPRWRRRGQAVPALAAIATLGLSLAMLADLAFFNSSSAVRVTNATLVAQEPAPVILAELLRAAGPGREQAAQDRAMFDPRLTTRLVLEGRRLRGADFRGSTLPRAMLRAADLRDAHLCLTDLRMAFLKGAVLTRAEMSRDTQLQQADLSGADLQGALLWRTDLRGANLRRANFAGADLTRADLRGADLRGADLRGASLWRTKLQGADLRCIAGDRDDAADAPDGQRCADLRGAALWGARFDGADLRGALLDTVGREASGHVLARTDQDTSFARSDVRQLRLSPVSATPPPFTAAASTCFSTDDHREELLRRLGMANPLSRAAGASTGEKAVPEPTAPTVMPDLPEAYDEDEAQAMATEVRKAIGCDPAIRYGAIERARNSDPRDPVSRALAAMLFSITTGTDGCDWSSPDPTTERVDSAVLDRLRDIAGAGVP